MAENTNSEGQQKPTLSWSQPAGAKPAVAANGKPAGAAPTVVKSAPAISNNLGGQTSNMGTYAGILAAGLIVGALIGWGITASKSGETSMTASSTSMTASSSQPGSAAAGAMQSGGGVNLTGSTVGSTGNISIPSPQAAGFAVAASKISVTQPTWLVVYEDHAGVPGNAIGAGLFFAGQNSGTIELLRATLPGQSYFVGQSLDDGDRIFSLQNDKPVRDAQGNPLFTEFTAQ